MAQGRKDRGRRPYWVAAAVLAVVWIGLAYVPGMHASWKWLARAAIFFVGAGLLWFAYDPGEPDEGV